MAKRVRDLFPTAPELLELDSEALAPILLELAANRRQGPEGMFWPNSIFEDQTHLINAPLNAYPSNLKGKVDRLINEAWGVLRSNALVMPASGTNGHNGYLVFTEAGEKASASGAAYDQAHAAISFPKSLLHPNIANLAWSALVRGDLGDAVFKSFRTVEEAVRSAGGYSATDIGVALMRKAFDAKAGPLAKMSDPEPEREALAHLFAGAIGSYKNPHSHRTVSLTDPREAQEQVMLASHLLRIIDARKKP